MKDPTAQTFNRRQFLKQSSIAAAGLAAYQAAPAIRAGAESPNETIVVGIMGLGRGMAHVESALDLPNVEIAYLCDVDEKRIAPALNAVRNRQARSVQGVQNFRAILDDRSVDALFIATCNHWHAPATILGCSSGKHVYVEKPGSHNPHESELMVEAARKYKRVVQMGNQRRSFPGIIEGMEKLHSGAIGNVLFSRCWYNNRRLSIGQGQPVAVPENLDYALWQGPAPRKPYKDNLVHYNWHWHWHWGNGELGNNGIHALDLSRWGLGVDYPLRVSYTGGRYHYDDDQETPDTGMATFDFGKKGASWDGSSCHPRPEENIDFVRFYGDGGSLAIRGGGYVIFDLDGKEVEKKGGPGGDLVHAANFIDCIRSGKKPNSEIGDAQKSTLLCHLGNIAYRTGHTIHFDPNTRRILNDPEAMALWKREYEPGWEPKV